MLRRYLYGIVAFVLAFGILSVSLLKSSSVTFAVAAIKPSPSPEATPLPEINYQLVFPGKITPGNFLWPLKAARDKVIYTLAFGHLKKAEFALLFADKRLGASVEVFKTGNIELGLTVLAKAEKYLETAAKEEKIARGEEIDTNAFLFTLASASLKHREVIEKQIVPISPGEASSHLTKILNYSKEIYRDTSEALIAKGKEAPKSPFIGQ